MASTYRLSGLTIFLILLAVLLIGYLLNHTWEYFSNRSEGFVTDYKNSSLSETVPGYSTNSKKVVQLDDRVYFDPVNKIFIEHNNSGLVIRKRDGTTDPKVYDNNEVFQVKGYTHTKAEAAGVCSRFGAQVATEQQLKDAQEKGANWCSTGWLADSDTAMYPISKPVNNGYGCGGNSTGIKHYTPSDGKAAVNCYGTKPKDDDSLNEWYKLPDDLSGNATYDAWVENNNLTHQYPTGTDATSKWSKYGTDGVIFDDSTANDSVGAAKPFGFVTEKKQAILYFPLTNESSVTDDKSTSVSFVHVMDLENNKHIATYYFNGSKLLMYPDNLTTLGRITGTSDASSFDSTALDGSGDSGTLSFTGSIEDELTGTDFKSKVEKDTSKKLLFFAARHNNEMVRAYISIGDDNSITIKKSETEMGELLTGDDSDDDSDDDDSDDDDVSVSKKNDSSSSSSGSNSATINELTNALNLVHSMQGLFGSSDSNYLLKTEVVPPVCPTCPSCPNSGVCTDCGGNGGSGTKTGSGGSGDSASSLARDAGTGATNLVRDGADGATNIARDTASGTLQVGKDVVSGTKDTVGDIASGTKDTIGQVASGTGEFVKDGVSGVYGAAKDVTQGTVGLGREIVQGVGGIFGAGSGGAGPSTANGGYYNSYGGPGGYGYPQPGPQVPGGYMNPGQYRTPGQDPYSYYGAVPGKAGGANYMPRTADFSSFGR